MNTNQLLRNGNGGFPGTAEIMVNFPLCLPPHIPRLFLQLLENKLEVEGKAAASKEELGLLHFTETWLTHDTLNPAIQPDDLSVYCMDHMMDSDKV